MERGKRKVIMGTVIGDAMDKTRVIEVERVSRHRLFSKVMRRRRKFYMHDEKNESHMGDIIRMMATRPLSKQKRWRLVEIVRKASVV